MIGGLAPWSLRSTVALLAAAAVTVPSLAGAEPLPVEAVNEGIYYHHWANAQQTIAPSQEVKFANTTGTVPHGLKFTGGTAGVQPSCTGVPPEVGATKWEAHCTFAKAGTYTFICTVHPTEMTGTITVTNGEPTVVTEGTSGLDEHEATLEGSVDPNGKATKYFFKWGLTEAYGEQTSSPPALEGNVARAVSARLSGLAPGTLYHYRLVAENEAGRAEGIDRTFMTVSPPGSPTAVTGGVSGVTETTATLGGTVDPNGEHTEFSFEWGTSSAYGELTEQLAVPGEDRVAHAESATLEGLLPATTYHFRLVAHNASGASDGADREFTTASPPPPPAEPTPQPTPQPTPGPTSPEPTVPLLTPAMVSEPSVPLGSALVAGSLKLKGHRSAVRGSLAVGRSGAGGHLEVELLAKPSALGGHGSKPIVVGRTVRSSVPSGTVSFSLSLTPRGKAALRRRRRLALTVTVLLTPPGGKAVGVTHALTLRV